MPSAPRGKKAQKYYVKQQREEIYDYDSRPDSITSLLIENGPGTLIITITLSIIYIITMILSENIFITDIEVVYPFVHLNENILEGEVWRLITSIFIHGSIFHLGGNLLFLLIFGWRFEELAGTKMFFLAFFLTGLGGNLATLSIELIGTFPNPSLGASGAIQGLLGASVAKMYFDHKYGRGGLAALSIMVIFFIFTIGAQTNFLAHFGGLITGVIFSYILHKRNK
ncbi:MAG: Rhomboid protease GluP [Candidatus Heimdallarchaeota archaeon LC_3]|nr:MAG: Rhomboid protease GluP [Candidatus Heimdallarchaeota archaeon LC_3]